MTLLLFGRKASVECRLIVSQWFTHAPILRSSSICVYTCPVARIMLQCRHWTLPSVLSRQRVDGQIHRAAWRGVARRPSNIDISVLFACCCCLC